MLDNLPRSYCRNTGENGGGGLFLKLISFLHYTDRILDAKETAGLSQQQQQFCK